MWWLLLPAGVFGCAIGSFLNVVAYRVPAGLSVSHPRSACPDCAHPITSRDNVPVVSWLALRGHCRHCGGAISPRYPLVEGFTAVLFLLAAARFGWSWTLPAVLVFFGGLMALAICDLEHYLLPRRIVYPTGVGAGALLVVAAGLTGEWHRLGIAAASAAVAFGIFFAINLANPRWLGFGDVRLMAVIGGVLGWLGPLYVLVALLAANALGLAVLIPLMATGKATRSTKVPYGAFLAVGAVLAVFLGDSVSNFLTTPH